MKVLHVIPSLSLYNGGPSHAIPGMCRALVRQGQRVTVFTTNIDGPGDLDVPVNRPVDMDGVEVRYFQIQYPRSYSFSLPLAKALKEELKGFDLVHVHSIFNWPIVPASFFCRKFDIPYIVRPCGILDPVPLKQAYGSGLVPASIDLKRRYLKRRYFKGRYVKSLYARREFLKKVAYLLLVERRNLEGAAAIHFTSKEESRSTLPYGIGAPSFVVPLGVDPVQPDADAGSGDLGVEYPVIKGKKIILFLSRIDAKKGLDLLIPALGTLATRRDDFVFVLAGRGDPKYETGVRKYVEQHGLSERTVLTGFVAGTAKWSLLRKASIFVLPSYHENFGVAVVEAMSAGLPVIVSERVGIHNEISTAGAGVVVPQDVPALARAISELLDNSDLRERVGRAAQGLVARKFAWDLVAKELIGVYQDILGGARQSPSWIH